MPTIVLLQHGETSSPDGPLTFQSCLDIIKVTVAIPSVLSKPMEPRPKIIHAPGNASEQTAILVAKMLLSKTESCNALGETISDIELRTFALRCLKSSEDIIAVSHATTIEAFIAGLITTSDRVYSDGHTKPLGALQFVVISAETRKITTATAPAKVLA